MTEQRVARIQDQRKRLYELRICGERPSCALTLLAVWERPWSSTTKRYAYHALHRALARGIDVLEV